MESLYWMSEYLSMTKFNRLQNIRGEFRISVSEGGPDVIRFWKTGYIFQTFQISKIENPKDFIIKFAKSNNMQLKLSDGLEIQEIFLDGKILPKEDWNDINPEEVTRIDMRTENTNTMKTIKYVNIYYSTK